MRLLCVIGWLYSTIGQIKSVGPSCCICLVVEERVFGLSLIKLFMDRTSFCLGQFIINCLITYLDGSKQRLLSGSLTAPRYLYDLLNLN